MRYCRGDSERLRPMGRGGCIQEEAFGREGVHGASGIGSEDSHFVDLSTSGRGLRVCPADLPIYASDAKAGRLSVQFTSCPLVR